MAADGSGIDRIIFAAPDDRLWANSFGLAHWTGLAALVLVVWLLAISNDTTLQRLKARLWKRLQRLNYALFVLVIAHAFFYGVLRRATYPYTLLLCGSVLAVVVGQGIGLWTWRKKFAGKAGRGGVGADSLESH